MSNTTTITAPAVPEVEIDLSQGEQLGDEILLDLAQSEKTATVKAGTRISEVRAWSFGGNVD